MKFANILWVTIPTLLCLFLLFVPVHSEPREHLLRHDESMRIVNLLDKILAKLKDELSGKRESKDHDVQDVNVQIKETEQQMTKLETELQDTTNRLDYLESMKQSIRQDADDAARSEEQVEKEIELVNKIKKVLVGDHLSASCQADTDCQEGFECDGSHCRVPADGECVASYECVASAECIYGKCTSVVGRGCDVDSDCTGGTVCYEFKCQIDVGEQCSTDEQCYTDICQNRRCKARFKDLCTSSLHCEEGTVCEDHHCLRSRKQACATNNDCATGYCATETVDQEDRKCLMNPCQGVSCANSLVCDPFEGDCRVPPGGMCSNTTQCINGLTCENEKCMAGLNQKCESSEHCISGLCYNGYCKLPSNSYNVCTDDSECATNQCRVGTPAIRRCLAGHYSYLDQHKTMGDMNLYKNGTQVVSDNHDHTEGSALLDISNSRGRWYFEVKCIDKKHRCHGASFGIAEHGHSNGVNGKHYGYEPYHQRILSHRGSRTYGDNQIQDGDVFGIDVDLDLGRIRFSKNGKFFGWRDDVQEGTYFPAIWDRDNGHRENLNMTVNTGFNSLVYAPPEKANRGWFGTLLMSQCFEDAECSGNLVCRNSKCKLPVGGYCISDHSCETNHCIQNKCLYHMGEDCDNDLQCASGICRNRLCSVGETSLLNLRSQMGNMEVSEYRTRVSWTRSDNWEGTILGEVGNEAGKWYYEVECIDDCRGATFGIASHSGHHDPSGRYYGWNPHYGRLKTSSGNRNYASDYNMWDKDVAGIYVDLDNSRIGFSMNGKWKGWSNTIDEGIYYPAIWDNDHNDFTDIRVNFGHYDFYYYDDESFHKGWFGGSVLSTCRSNVECEGNMECHDARCRYPLGETCSADKECSSPWCYNNRCTLKVGDYCSYGEDCASGRCSHGRCSTKQYTTFDPSTASGDASLSAGFTEVDMNRRGCVLANTANTYGKWYYEVECLANNCRRLSAGIATDIGTYQPSGDYYAYRFDDDCESNHGHNSFSTQNVRDGDVVGVAVDLEVGKIGYYLNSNWLGWCYTNIEPNQQYFPVLYDNDNNRDTAAMVNFGYYDFSNKVPTGYNAGWFSGLLLSSCEQSEDNSMYGCNSGLMCYQGYCRLPPSETCRHADECTTNSCYNNKCVQMAGDRCESNQECATGICNEGRCDTGEYAVWNPRTMVGDIETRDISNTVLYSSGNNEGVILGTKGKTSGKHYYEIECLDDCDGLFIGIATSPGSNWPDGKYMGFEPHDRNIYYTSQNNRNYGSFSGNTRGEVLGIYVDLDNRRMGIEQRNQWMGWFSRNIDELTDDEQYFPAAWDAYNNGHYHFEIRTNFGFYDWNYEVDEEYAHGWQ